MGEEMITDDRLSRALQYLAETDEPCAKARGLLAGLERQEKTVKSIALLETSGQKLTISEREAVAYSSSAYREHTQKIADATTDYETMRNRRLTAEMIVEVWRSMNANRRRGNV